LPHKSQAFDTSDYKAAGRVQYIFMGTSPTVAPRQVGILVLDNDPHGASAVKQVLDSEGWRVRVVPDAKMLLAELKSADWSLVVANAAAIDLDSPAFFTLREIASVPQENGGRIRALFVIPETSERQFTGPIEAARLPYVVRPYHLHDFLEKVSDLLVEIKVIEAPIRLVRREFGALRKKKKQGTHSNSMFASRDTFSYTEEEIAEYEREEAEASKNKRNKPRVNLGDPYR
jgi:DNA-binding response OmpR family regulator